MNKLIVLLIVFAGVSLEAQQIDVRLKDASQRKEASGVTIAKQDRPIKLNLGNPNFKSKINEPWIIVDGIVSTLKSPSFTPEKIKSITVLKDKTNLPKRLVFLEGKMINGIIEIELKPEYKIEAIALKQYNVDLKLPLDTSVFIDGVELQETSILIDQKMIREVSWVEVDGQEHVALFTTPKVFKEVQ